MNYPLTDKNGNLTQVGLRAQQVYNDYVTAGISPMVAAQVLGGQLVEDPALNAAQVQSINSDLHSLKPAPDASIVALFDALKEHPGRGVGLSQWTDSTRQQAFMDFINNNYNPHDSALDESAAFTYLELIADHYADAAKTNRFTFLAKLEEILANAPDPLSAAEDLQSYIENKF
jgi:hypothetical protein